MGCAASRGCSSAGTRYWLTYTGRCGLAPSGVPWDTIEDDVEFDPLCASPEVAGWAALPEPILARVFELADSAKGKVLGWRPRQGLIGPNRRIPHDQQHELGGDLEARTVFRLVCRSWRTAHDNRFVVSLRPRELHEDILPYRFPNLTRLDLSRVSYPDMASLALLLKRQKSLRCLTMRDNGTGHVCSAVLGSALASHITLLHTLNIGENYIDDRGATSLAEALKTNRTLTTLNVRDNGVSDAGAAALGEVFRTNTSLRSLDLSSNDIYIGGAVGIAHGLEQAQAITDLNLGGNKLGDEGARVLAGALVSCRTLTSLSLWGNGVEDGGAEALGAALKQNRSLVSLDLFGAPNKIGDSGAAGLADGVRFNTVLSSLDLFDNNAVRDAGILALCDALSQNTALATLRLSSLAGLGALAGRAAHLAGSRISTKGVSRIRNAPITEQLSVVAPGSARAGAGGGVPLPPSPAAAAAAASMVAAAAARGGARQ